MRGETGDLSELLVDPPSCDQNCRCVRGAEPGASDTFRAVLGAGAGLNAEMCKERRVLDRSSAERLSNHSMPCAIGRSSWASSLRVMYGSAIRMPPLRSNRRCPWCCDVESPEPALTASDLHVVMCCAMCTFTCTPC